MKKTSANGLPKRSNKSGKLTSSTSSTPPTMPRNLTPPPMWKDKDQNSLNEDAKKDTVITLLKEWYGIDAAAKVDIFMARDNPRFPSWIKLTFTNMYEKFNFESRLKSHREEKKALGIKTFFLSRLTPLEFAPIKKKLIEAAANKSSGLDTECEEQRPGDILEH